MRKVRPSILAYSIKCYHEDGNDQVSKNEDVIWNWIEGQTINCLIFRQVKNIFKNYVFAYSEQIKHQHPNIV